MIKKIISTQSTNICKGFKNTQIQIPYKPKKCPFLSHNFMEHIKNISRRYSYTPFHTYGPSIKLCLALDSKIIPSAPHQNSSSARKCQKSSTKFLEHLLKLNITGWIPTAPVSRTNREVDPPCLRYLQITALGSEG